MGNTKRVRKVAMSNPPMTTVANGRCTSAPEPLLKAMGKKPNEATKAVINTGRNRIFVPFNTTCLGSDSPDFLILLNSATKTMPLSTATPNKAINPTPALILNGIPRKARNKIPPMAERGMAE